MTDPAMLAALAEWLDASKLTSAQARAFEAGWRAREREGNTLPLDQVPEGWVLTSLKFDPSWRHDSSWHACFENERELRTFGIYGPTPRAAVLAAIAKIGE